MTYNCLQYTCITECPFEGERTHETNLRTAKVINLRDIYNDNDPLTALFPVLTILMVLIRSYAS